MRVAWLLFAFACRGVPLPLDTDTSDDPDADDDGDGVTALDDCNDGDAGAFPGAPEACDGVDNDCDGQIDEPDPTNTLTWYPDADRDGFGDDGAPIVSCLPPPDTADQGGDCDDTRDDVFPGAPETDCADATDYNCDGVASAEDGDQDGVVGCDDCDDGDPSVFPGADETCNDEDDDCDGTRDEDAVDPLTFYADVDRDGYGDAAAPIEACERPTGAADNALDCDDDVASVRPDAVEVCNDRDDDCDGLVDDGGLGGGVYFPDQDRDGFGAGAPVSACTAPDGTAPSPDDCDDRNAAVNPDAVEVCNGTDDDCEGGVDEGFDGDRDGFTTCGGDCDDTKPAIRPGQTELCDGADNDCDALTDDADPDRVGGSTWYIDRDGDRYGTTAATRVGCAAPDGYVRAATDCDDSDRGVNPDAPEICDGRDQNCRNGADEGFDVDGDGATSCGGDCNDTNTAVRPGAAEACNGQDDDCDGLVDDADPGRVGGTPFYTDADGDLFGDALTAAIQCVARSGQVGTPGDCDDRNNQANPAKDEKCNNFDDDCDTVVDEPDAIDAPTWYADADTDTYGARADATRACRAPAGRVADNTDCDDRSRAVNPGATERCNNIDDDCNEGIDESSAADATLWYPDRDQDTYGAASAGGVRACRALTGTVADHTDCLDSDRLAYPNAPERSNGQDDDCDGLADEGLWPGTGADGALSVTGTFDLGRDRTGSRLQADGVAYVVRAIAGGDVTVTAASAAGIGVGDEVLLINLHGTDAAHAGVGTYAFGRVRAASGAVLTLDPAPTALFGQASNGDLSGQSVLVQRVPHYTTVNVGSTGVLTARPWDGATGGIVAFRASQSVTVAAGGRISADALGYAGGDTGLTGDNCDAYQGESYAGRGEGEGNGVCTGGYNENWGQWAANYGGGGAHITGGGGNHAGGAQAGASWTGGSATPPAAGAVYGSAQLDRWFFGSGGGGVWSGQTGQARDHGPGGDGGGVVFIASPRVLVLGTDGVVARGGTTRHWATGTWTYGAGGGAGGTVWLYANDLDLATGAVDVMGGNGRQDGVIRAGGNGGFGRIRLDFDRFAGVAAPSAAALDVACDPAPGFTTRPAP